jgi:hypothetical protein
VACVGLRVRNPLQRTAKSPRRRSCVLASMPRMPDPMLGALDGRAYGLVWRDALGPAGPAGEEHVGLTIAGLVRLSERHAPLKVLADHLTEIISSLAAAERDTIADPRHAVRPAIALDSHIQGITARTADHLLPIPAPVVLDILRREHAPLMITVGPESPKARPTIYRGHAQGRTMISLPILAMVIVARIAGFRGFGESHEHRVLVTAPHSSLCPAPRFLLLRLRGNEP